MIAMKIAIIDTETNSGIYSAKFIISIFTPMLKFIAADNH